jgi:hypothetical protein
MRPARATLHLAMLCALLGCRRGAKRELSDSTFVATMAQLRKIERDTTLDDSARSAARHLVLRSQHVTPEQLERTAGALADNPEHALAVWGAIDRRLRAKAQAPALPRRRSMHKAAATG